MIGEVRKPGQGLAPLREWRRREVIDHRKLNEPVKAINDMLRGVDAPRAVVPIARPEVEQAAAIPTRYFTLFFHLPFSTQAVHDDYVWGVPAKGDGSYDVPEEFQDANGDPVIAWFQAPDTYVAIAKPLELRRSYYDGKTFTHPDTLIGARRMEYRTPHHRLSVGGIAGSGPNAQGTEVQWITPAYESPQAILCQKVGAALIGVTTEPNDGPPVSVSWLEVNDSHGRAWAAEEST